MTDIEITDEMIEQAKEHVQCVMNFAHHEHVFSRRFTVDWFGEEMEFILCVCLCGRVEYFTPLDGGGMVRFREG
jgi:hypothetical protein